MTPRPTLKQLWRKKAIHDRLVCHLTNADLAPCRLLCRDLAAELAPIVFVDTTITLRRRALTRQSRLLALKRIGAHIQTITFKIPHTTETFPPPVIDRITGTEQTFVYMSQGHRASYRHNKYGSHKTTDLLVQQYPPLFHTATDIVAFERALSFMRDIRHLRIYCRGQPPSHRYRRSVVDYALISLRVAVERAALPLLESLSLLSVHPAAALYLRPDKGFGGSPASRKRWSQIRSLTIHMDSFQYQPGLPTDHFKLLHAYLQSFYELRKLVFHWVGEKNLSPLSLASEPYLQSTTSSIESTPSYLNRSSSLRGLRFHHLEQIELANVITDASQIASFISVHRPTLMEFNVLESTLRTGTWDDALAPMNQLGAQRQCKENPRQRSLVDVPLVLSQQQLQRVICAAQQQRGGLRGLKKARARERLWGKPEHMKRM
ncbi:hypothetical protein N7478_008129 [Penicillium angulare]|uniref:uncharacterized protein n=1 Tax=Penicillium angulare TaxID=116970 RepID=UPI0025415D45|nr:uncharacterized protein N7478_008129 [Penicillium angulare]KAJ5273004.1 hypothetical protein N7478_008129 [Penicillium angulare]